MNDRDRRPEDQFAYGAFGHGPMDVDVDAEHDPARAQRMSSMLLNRELERYTSQGKIPSVMGGFEQPAPTASDLAFGPAGAQTKGEAAQQGQDHDRKVVLAREAYDFGYDTFLMFQNEADASLKLLDKADVPETDATKQLLGFATSALLGAGAGALAGWFFGAITAAGLANKAAGLASSLVSSTVKSALTTGEARSAASLADIRLAFGDAIHLQLDVARRSYVGHQEQLAATLSAFGVDQLQLLVDALKDRDPDELRAKMRHETLVAWTNFLARAKHGEMRAWDYWTENGSPGALATSAAEPKPSAGGMDHSNIKPDNNSPLLEDTQRPMQEEAFGVLEIFVDTTGKNVIDHPGYRMRLDNVGPRVREEFRNTGKVRDLKVNKVVHMCTSVHNGVLVDPPTSIASVMITADGYVRAHNWSELQKVHFEPKKGPMWDPTGFHGCMNSIIDGNETADCHIDRNAMAAEISAFANAAQELPLSWLEV